MLSPFEKKMSSPMITMQIDTNKKKKTTYFFPRKSVNVRSVSTIARGDALKIVAKEIAKQFICQQMNEIKNDCVDMFNNSIEDNKMQITTELETIYGEEGLHSFHEQFKNINKIEKIIDSKTLVDSPTVSFIKTIDSFKIPPKSRSIIRKYEHLHNIDIDQFSIGNKYASSLGKAIKDYKSLHELIASSNRLTNKGAYNILNNLPLNVQVLDLSYNNLAKDSFEKLASFISDTKRK